MKHTSVKRKLQAVLLALCMVLSLVPVIASADDAGDTVDMAVSQSNGINYIDAIHVTYEYVDYKAGEAPRATAAVDSGSHCTVAYERWGEIYQPKEGGVWHRTGRYWYSDPNKMASLSADKRITQFEAGHHYSYDIVLTTERGYFISGDQTVVSVGNYEWGTPGHHTNLEIREMSTKLFIYSPYSIDIPTDSGSTDTVITAVSIVNVNTDLNASTPVAFTAQVGSECAGQFDITEESWASAYSESIPTSDVIKSTGTTRAPIAGGEYWYSIVLTARDGYVFSKDFSGENCIIKEGSGVTFTVDGTSYRGAFAVSDNGKTLTAWEFMSPVTVKSAQQSDPTPVDYKIIEGANGSWTQNSDGTLSFRANGAFSKFTGIKVDGKPIPAEQYTTVAASMTVALTADFLKTLLTGDHTLTVVYADGECSTGFSVKAAQQSDPDTKPDTKPGTPDTKPGGSTQSGAATLTSAKTADSSQLTLWSALLVISCGTLAWAVVSKKRSINMTE